MPTLRFALRQHATRVCAEVAWQLRGPFPIGAICEIGGRLPLRFPACGHVFGIINIHKPAGLTSRDVVDRVVRVVRPAKAGHAGTLDPMATGVLVVCVGPATRLIEDVQSQVKEYRAEFTLGVRSDTDDVTGNVVATENVAPIPREVIEELLSRFVGRIAQVPPQFSAVHVGGQRAYKLARRGEAVEIAAREVDVHTIELLDYAFPKLVLRIECGSGTYVRSIGRDLGELLGCGAAMSVLVRTRVGVFNSDDAVSLDDLSREAMATHLQPALRAVPGLQRYIANAEELAAIRNGKLFAAREPLTGSSVAVLDAAGELACIAEYLADKNLLAPKRVFIQG